MSILPPDVSAADVKLKRPKAPAKRTSTVAERIRVLDQIEAANRVRAPRYATWPAVAPGHHVISLVTRRSEAPVEYVIVPTVYQKGIWTVHESRAVVPASAEDPEYENNFVVSDGVHTGNRVWWFTKLPAAKRLVQDLARVSLDPWPQAGPGWQPDSLSDPVFKQIYDVIQHHAEPEQQRLRRVISGGKR